MSLGTGSAVEVAGVRKSYPSFDLGELLFTLPRGYLMGLIGPNGAGKTTTIRLLLGLTHQDAGRVSILGCELSGHEAALLQRVGFVHEAPAFYGHLTVAGMQSVVSPHYERWDEGRFRELAAVFELPLRKRVGALSKGMRAKLALALALSHHAELLVMDEPASGLDPVARRRLLELLQELIRDEGVSVVLSTHITSDLERVADYVTFLQRGKAVFSTTRDELRERYALVRGPPELAASASGPAFHGMRRGEVGFRVLTSDALQARQTLGPTVAIEPASLEDIMEHMGRVEP